MNAAVDAVSELEKLCRIEDVTKALSTGDKVVARPMVVRQLAPFARALREIPEDVIAGLVAQRFDALSIAESLPAIAKALHVATGMDEDKLLDMGLDDLLLVATAVIEVNADFFLKRLTPVLEGAVSRLTEVLGAKFSSDSSTPATDATTS